MSDRCLTNLALTLTRNPNTCSHTGSGAANWLGVQLDALNLQSISETNLPAGTDRNVTPILTDTRPDRLACTSQPYKE
jgi:hypothetical protein